jgi:hypothetical protein
MRWTHHRWGTVRWCNSRTHHSDGSVLSQGAFKVRRKGKRSKKTKKSPQRHARLGWYQHDIRLHTAAESGGAYTRRGCGSSTSEVRVRYGWGGCSGTHQKRWVGVHSLQNELEMSTRSWVRVLVFGGYFLGGRVSLKEAIGDCLRGFVGGKGNYF